MEKDVATETIALEAGTVKPIPTKLPKETGGPKRPEPTRYGDWEYKGRCVDF